MALSGHTFWKHRTRQGCGDLNIDVDALMALWGIILSAKQRTGNNGRSLDLFLVHCTYLINIAGSSHLMIQISPSPSSIASHPLMAYALSFITEPHPNLALTASHPPQTLYSSPFGASPLFPFTLTISVSNTSTLFAGIGPIPLLPYAHSGCIVSVRFSPGHMSSRPSSQPFMTWPLPSWKGRGWLREKEESNSEPIGEQS